MRKIFPGYDARSPTLRCGPRCGPPVDCMHGLIEDKYVTLFYDSAAAIFSGDLVRLEIRYADCTAFIVKFLRVSRQGRWWAECADGVFEIGHLVRVSSIAKVVALDTVPLTSTPPSLASYLKASPSEAENFAVLAEDVVEEWKTLGHVDGVRFPGIEFVNHRNEDGTLNPQLKWEPLPA